VSPISSGVPKGGHRSPILFARFINGFKKMLPNTNILALADVLKIFRRISNECDCFLLQDELVIKYSPVLHKLSLSMLADRRVVNNLNFLKNLIDASVDVPTLFSLINFRVPPRRTRSTTIFTIPMHATNYSANNPVYPMMRLANVHSSFSLLFKHLVPSHLADLLFV
jgi:hypothetical protein